MNTYKYLIGIDPGVTTGVACWDVEKQCFDYIGGGSFWEAVKYIDTLNESPDPFSLVIEDARKVKFGTDPRRAQGAGSVKRDSKLWEEYAQDRGIQYRLVRPNPKLTKLSDKAFRKVTNWAQHTNQHGRDAAMLVFGAKR